MKAVVMAGGAGSRLRPLTVGRPKPMLPLVNQVVLGHILELLRNHGITEVVVTLQYMASMIEDYFGDGSSMGVRIHYSIEESPLGTAGSVAHARAVSGRHLPCDQRGCSHQFQPRRDHRLPQRKEGHGHDRSLPRARASGLRRHRNRCRWAGDALSGKAKLERSHL